MGNNSWHCHKHSYICLVYKVKKNKVNKTGEERFNEYYSSLYLDRWPELKEALKGKNEEKVLLPNLLSPYYMDEASIIAASLLPVERGDSVLDMCAAPGGKSLVIASRLGSKGTLVANDRSPERRMRMKNVFSSCLGETGLDIKITGYNAESWGLYEQNKYDAILLDAPCSSERHVINDPKYLSAWSESRPKRLSISQYAMLSSALIAVKENGYILYSTCSINSEENEGVIAKLLTRHSSEVDIIDTKCDYGEKRKYGTLILPDRSNGIGPMYFCLIRKRGQNGE